MMDLLYGYRDEQGQPIPGSLGADRLLKINDLQQRINDIRASQERNDNLTPAQREELKEYVLALKNNPKSLTTEQMQRYVELTNMKKSDGLSTLEQSQLEGAYAELAELSSKIPTEYYMTALNFYLEKQNIPPVEAKDIENYVGMLKIGGILVMDDASLYLESPAGMFKGHPDVGAAIRDRLDTNLAMKHLFAVGHNRVWRKVS
jgi:hypothetical protein